MTIPVEATSVSTIAGIPVRTTDKVITPHTKICMMVVGDPKTGKTTLAATMDDMTRKFFGKPTLVIALEPADDGGMSVLEDHDPPVPFVTPQTYEEFNKIMAWLAGDPTYGGVVIDTAYEYVNRFLKPHALKMPYTRGTPDPNRASGVPGESDYHTMGEQGRQDFNKLINLTKSSDPKLRKHLLVTAHMKERTSRDRMTLLSIGPDLPGSLASVATSMFPTVAEIQFKHEVVPDPADPKKTKRISKRILATDPFLPENTKHIIGDRTKCVPQGSPVDIAYIWENGFLPKIERASS